MTEAENGGDACQICGGMGFVVPNVPPGHASFGRAVPCTCRLEQQEARRHENLLRLSQLGLLRDALKSLGARRA